MNEDKIIQKLLEHDERFNKMDEEIREFRQEYLDGQDKIMKILIRLDEERVFTLEAIRRMQDEIDEQKKKIIEHDQTLAQVKLHLNIA